MADTTKAAVLLTAPELSSITDDDRWDQALADAALELAGLDGNDKEERAQRLWVAHTLTSRTAAGSVVSETVGGVSRTYAQNADDAEDLTGTKYGRALLQLLANDADLRLGQTF